MSTDNDTNPQLDALRQQASTIADQIFNVVKISRPTVKESVFKEYFLPVLTDTSGKPVNLNYWIDYVALNPNSEVVVVDDNAEKELFVVPAIFNDSSLFDVSATRLRSIVDVLHEASLISRDSNSAAQMYYQKMFTNGVHLTNPDSSVSRWLFIFNRYKIKIPGLDIKPTAAAPITTTNDELYTGQYEDPDI